jgi:hypothetical protein
MNQPIIMTRVVLMVVMLVLYLTGATVTQGAQKIDACAMLTKSEIEAAIGQNVSDGKLDDKKSRLGANIYESCQYMVGSASVLIVVVAAVYEPADKVIERQKGQKDQTVSDVPNLGDKSFFISGFGMLQLNTYKGNTNLLITMTVPEPSKELAMKTASEKLMRMALMRI